MTARTLAAALTIVTLLLAAPEAHAEPGWTWPVGGEVLTPYRNGDDPYAGGQHRGIDIAADAGSRVVAAAGGTVTFVGVAGDSGLTVSIRTSDGRFDTSYLHLASAAVGRGDHVAGGDAIATVGTTGRRSIVQPHLHFGVRVAGERQAYVDPLTLLPLPPVAEPPAPRAVPVAIPEPGVPELVPPALIPSAAPAPATVPAPALAPSPALVPSPVPVPGPSMAGAAAPASAAAPVPGLAIAPVAVPAGPSPAVATAPGLAAVSTRAPIPSLGPRASSSPLRHRVAATRSSGPLRSHATPSSGTRPSRTPATASSGPSPARAAAAPPSGPAGSRLDHPRRPAPATRAHRAAPHPAVRAGRDNSGLDLGWLAGCAGLAVAATMLGRPRGPLASLRRARSFAAGSTRPLRERA